MRVFLKCRFYQCSSMVRPTNQETVAIEKIACYSLFPRGGDRPHHTAGPHGEAPGSVMTQKQGEIWFLWEQRTRRDKKGLASLNNLSRLRDIGTSLCCLVPGPRVIRAGGQWPESESSIKGCLVFSLVPLHIKGVLPEISQPWKVPKCQLIIKDMLNRKRQRQNHGHFFFRQIKLFGTKILFCHIPLRLHGPLFEGWALDSYIFGGEPQFYHFSTLQPCAT